MIAVCDRNNPSDPVIVMDLTTGAQCRVITHEKGVVAVAIDAAGERIATGAARVWCGSAGSPARSRTCSSAARARRYAWRSRRTAGVSRRRAASEILLWPIPDLTKPPLHTLPYDELLAKLETLTNLRAVRDPSSDTGWKVEIGPFPGWREVPTW